MKIVVDENMPLAEAFFGHCGTVVRLPGRQISREDLVDADALLVRSVTKVDQSLIEGTPVRFVGSATIGMDHIDEAYLRREGIAVASAPGCNADAVVNYVLACLLELEEAQGIPVDSLQVGIVGYGNVGSRLKLVLNSMGVKTVVCDPLLADESFVSLDEALSADVVSLHVPMEKGGEYPTHHLLDEGRLKALKPNSIIINTSRGSVIDNQALRHVLEERADLTVVLDVWENEPLIGTTLAGLVEIATPHIAGYSYDGKVKGTAMVYDALCQHLGQKPTIKLEEIIEKEYDLTIDPKQIFCREESRSESKEDSSTQLTARHIVQAVYSIGHDDESLRRTLFLSADERAKAFDQLRKHYRLRREFSTVTIKNASWMRENLSQRELTRLNALGFRF